MFEHAWAMFNLKVIALERPVETGHAYRMRLQAINDPRV